MEGGLKIRVCTFRSSRWSWPSGNLGGSPVSFGPSSFFVLHSHLYGTQPRAPGVFTNCLLISDTSNYSQLFLALCSTCTKFLSLSTSSVPSLNWPAWQSLPTTEHTTQGHRVGCDSAGHPGCTVALSVRGQCICPSWERYFHYNPGFLEIAH